jgi:glucose-6-phosphate isomerase
MDKGPLLDDYPAHHELQVLTGKLDNTGLAQMVLEDPARAKDFSLSAAGLQLDFSKQLIDREILSSLLQLAEQASIPAHVEDLMSGQVVNTTEHRPALHTLLRASSAPNKLQSQFSEVCDTRDRMKSLVTRLNDGLLRGFTGERITDVVNIGIGGSDLGPRLVNEALKPFHKLTSAHFVANVDPSDLQNTVLALDPARTLFILCSKSFNTEETLCNALAARNWLLNAGASSEQLKLHFLAVTSNLQAAAEFGISAENCLPVWDWVGGRYSVWSAIGLSCAASIGWENFEQFQAGAEAMDQHFASAEPARNMPLLMSLLEIWNTGFLGAGSHVVLPYCNDLGKLPDYLQQLTMESNGKGVSATGQPPGYETAPVLWGCAGTMGQHSFHQLLHQGTRLCPVDFVLPLTTHYGMTEQHRRLVANCLAQGRTLMLGRSEIEAREALMANGLSEKDAGELAPHLAMPGNRPSSTITMDALTPATLGALLALYEQRTFSSAMLWGINPFDQWGVELGKQISSEVLARLSGEGDNSEMDPSTQSLIDIWRKAQDSSSTA